MNTAAFDWITEVWTWLYILSQDAAHIYHIYLISILHTHIHIYLFIYTCTYTYTHAHFLSLSLYIYIYMYMHIYIYISLSIYIYIYIHMYVHIHAYLVARPVPGRLDRGAPLRHVRQQVREHQARQGARLYYAVFMLCCIMFY